MRDAASDHQHAIGAQAMASIRKRTWNTKGKGEQTAWIVAYLHNGKQHIKTFSTKKAATEWRAEMTVDKQKGVHVPASTSITVADAAARWLDEARNCDPPLEASTVAAYEQAVRLHINPYLGLVKLVDLSAAVIEDFRNRLRRDGRSPVMVKKVTTTLGGIIGGAVEDGLAARNPVRQMAQGTRHKRRARLAKRHEKRLEVGVDIPSKDELRLILAHAPARWRPLIVTAVFTGLRASELRGLTWKDVEPLKAATLRVRQRADRWDTIGSPKSATSAREVPLAPMVVNTLKEWRLACPKGEAGLVFPDDDGKVEALHNIHRNALGKAQRDAGMCDSWKAPKYGMHSLRHAAASLFIEQGFTPKKVQALMGHSSIQMTFDTYGHLFPSQESDQEAMRQLQARLVG
jgi:integrase